MANTVLPLSSDIYLEVDGKKVAVVQSYTTRATRTSREIEAFGENEPVATIAGANKYTLELSRLYATDEAISDGINFYDLNAFSLVICKPDQRIIYSPCRGSSIEEAGKLGEGEDALFARVVCPDHRHLIGGEAGVFVDDVAGKVEVFRGGIAVIGKEILAVLIIAAREAREQIHSFLRILPTGSPSQETRKSCPHMPAWRGGGSNRNRRNRPR